jgi:hypothetical protein
MIYQAAIQGSIVIVSFFFTVNIFPIKLMPRACTTREFQKIINLFTCSSLNCDVSNSDYFATDYEMRLNNELKMMLKIAVVTPYWHFPGVTAENHDIHKSG